MSDVTVFSDYKSVEQTVNDGSTDTEISLSAADTKLRYAEKIFIRTDQTITVKFNSTDNNAFTVTSAGLVIEFLRIEKIFISNASGSNAAVKLLMFGPRKLA